MAEFDGAAASPQNGHLTKFHEMIIYIERTAAFLVLVTHPKKRNLE